jgi:hypothetical protein
MKVVVLKEWAAIPQDWVNELVLQQDGWVHVLMTRHGWSTVLLINLEVLL